MTVDIATLGIRIDSSDARIAARDMDNFRGAGARAEQQVTAIDAAARKAAQALQFLGIGAGVGAIIKMADEYTKFTAQLQLATQSQREYAAALEDVRRIATTAQQDLAATGTLYARIANGTRELGISQKNVADITETVNLALKVSGATSAEAASAMLQLSQSFASGTLRGEEFNAVNEAAPRLMKALADGIGVPVGALKDMASNGEITSKVMAQVLPQALQQLQEEAKHVQTISGAFTVLKNNVLEFTGTQAQANGTVAALTGGIMLLANNLNVLMGVVGTITALNVVNWLTAWTTKTYERITAVYAQVAAENAARAATIAGAEAQVANTAATAAGLQATQAAIVVSREEMVARLSVANANIQTAQASIISTEALAAQARAAIAASSAAGALSAALRVLRDSTRELAVQEAIRVGLQADLAIAEQARVAATAELAILGQQQARVSAQVTAATAAQTAAQTALTAATGTAAASSGLLSRAMGLLGGPVGAIITVLGLAATAWSWYSSRSTEANTKTTEETKASTAEVVAQMTKQIEVMERRNKMALAGAPTTGKQNPLDDKLADIVAQIDQVGKAEGDYAKVSYEARGEILKVLGGQYAEVTALIERFNKASADGAGNTAAAKALVEVRERLTGVSGQYQKDLKTYQTALAEGVIGMAEYKAGVTALAQETWKGSEAGKAAITAANKSAEAYKTLISSIREATATNKLELAAGEDATESQKTRIKVDQELASGKLKLGAAQLASVRAALDEQALTEASIKLQKSQTDTTKFIVASTAARDASARSLAVEYATYGQVADARELEMVALKSQEETEKRLDDMRLAKLPITDQIIAQLKAEEAARTSVGQATLAQSKALGYAGSLKTENTKFAADSLADPKARADALLAIDADVWQQRIKLAGDGTEAQRILQAEYGVWYANQQKRLTSEVDVTRATELLKIMEAVDESARQAAQGMADSFGAVGRAVGDLTTALTGYQRAQATIAAQLAASTQDAKGDPTKVAKAQAIAAQQGAQAQIKSYGDMASAAKGFFSENSKGYKLLETTEKAFRAYEMAMALETMVKKIFFKEGEVAANVALNGVKLTGEAATTAASTGLAATEASAWGITAVVKAMASLPFPFNLAAGAVTLAAVLAIGAKVMGGVGGGGIDVAKQRQETQGTGTVLGAESAKAESIGRSIENIEKYSSVELSHTRDMLSALVKIRDTIGVVAAMATQTSGLRATALDEKNYGVGSSSGVLGIGASSTSIQDSGIKLNGGQTIGSAVSAGVDATGYADILKKNSGLWGIGASSSTRRDVIQLDDDLKKQFGLLVGSMRDGTIEAVKLLGVSTDGILDKINGMALGINEISFKGLTGEEIQKELEAVFSKVGDDIAKLAVPELAKYQEVGEGYLETLTRVATDYATIDSVLEASGRSFGAVGLASVEARERLIKLAGGLDALVSNSQSFNDNFLSEAERLAPVQKYVTEQLAAMGLQGITTRDQFKDVVLGLDLTTESGAKQYTALLALADAFAKTHAATIDLTKSEQEIADERSDLQNKLDDLTMTQAQLADKARNAIDEHNRALYDQVLAAQAAKDAVKDLFDNLNNAYSALEVVVNREKSALNAAYQAASDKLKASIDSVTASVTKLQSLSQSLHSTLDSLNGVNAGASDRQAAQAQIDAALAIAKAGGPLPDADSLKSALSTVSKDASDQFSTYLDYQRDLYRTQNSVSQLADLTDSQLSTAEETLDVLKAQKDLLDKNHTEDLAKLDAMLDEAKTQVDLLNGISTSLMSLPQALAQIAAAIAAVKGNAAAAAPGQTAAAYQQYLGRTATASEIDFWQGQAATGVNVTGAIAGSDEAKIQDLYKTLLGRPGEAAGVDAWEAAIKAGMSWDQVKQGFLGSDEYKKLHSFDVGTNSVPYDMIANIHEGERIIPAADNRELMARLRAPVGDNSDLVAELQAQRAENAEMRQMLEAHLYAIAKSTRNTEDFLDGAVNGGIPFATKEVEETA